MDDLEVVLNVDGERVLLVSHVDAELLEGAGLSRIRPGRDCVVRAIGQGAVVFLLEHRRVHG